MRRRPAGLATHAAPRVCTVPARRPHALRAGSCDAPGVPARRTIVASVLVFPWVAWAAVRLLGLDLRYPVVPAVAFTPYAAVVAWPAAAAAVALRRRGVALAGVIAAALLGAVVLPRALGDGRVPAGADGPTLRVMSLNTFDGHADMAAVMRLAREQDVELLSLQELTPEALARLDAAGGRARFPGRAVEARPLAAGSGLFARRPLRARSPDDPTAAEQPEAELRLPSAPPLRVKAVHPYPPITAHAEPAWRAALARLPRPGAPPRGPLRLLLGDFNATLDHAPLRDLIDDGYVDAADATGEGLVPTWSSGRTKARITIDHVLLDGRLGVRSFSVHHIAGSDHRAIVAVLVLPQG